MVVVEFIPTAWEKIVAAIYQETRLDMLYGFQGQLGRESVLDFFGTGVVLEIPGVLFQSNLVDTISSEPIVILDLIRDTHSVQIRPLNVADILNVEITGYIFKGRLRLKFVSKNSGAYPCN